MLAETDTREDAYLTINILVIFTSGSIYILTLLEPTVLTSYFLLLTSVSLTKISPGKPRLCIDNLLRISSCPFFKNVGPYSWSTPWCMHVVNTIYSQRNPVVWMMFHSASLWSEKPPLCRTHSRVHASRNNMILTSSSKGLIIIGVIGNKKK